MAEALAPGIRAAQRLAAPWPYQELDVPELIASGWSPTPIHDVVLKVHQRCNLACDYCYVYEHADQTWRGRPPTMSAAVRQAAVEAIGRHVRDHGLTAVRVIMHGGEPLLYGADRLGEAAAAARAAVPADCAVEVGIQTNGVGLTEATVAALTRQRIRVGVSVDGVEADHDRHRRTRAGRGSYAAVRKGLDVLRRPEFAASYAGILCTVAPGTDPVGCYEQLVAFQPPVLDFLLPHATWDHPPDRPGDAPAPYADWLIAVFDRWYADPPGVRVRLFEDLISLLLGGAARGEQLGLSPSAVLVIESDGTMEQVDALKTAYDGAAATGLDVFHHELDDVLQDPGIVARQIGLRALADGCHSCSLVQICGGGHYAHRYRKAAGFRNPSVYCADLQRFIRHVAERLRADLLRPGSRQSP